MKSRAIRAQGGQAVNLVALTAGQLDRRRRRRAGFDSHLVKP